MTPFSLYKKNFPQLCGFQKTHEEYTINNRSKVTIKDYMATARLLRPDLCVTVFEDVESEETGKKKVQRAVRHSILAFEEISKTEGNWVAPVLVEEPKMLKSISEKQAIMIYGGSSLKLAGLFDSLLEICQGRSGLKGLA